MEQALLGHDKPPFRQTEAGERRTTISCPLPCVRGTCLGELPGGNSTLLSIAGRLAKPISTHLFRVNDDA
jgi:hypothetical protein